MIPASYALRNVEGSPSSRRAWIEIAPESASGIQTVVALLAEGVDRNLSVSVCWAVFAEVALLAEGVDRNLPVIWRCCSRLPSPSSRRAWIEIKDKSTYCGISLVALLAEGVDRNSGKGYITQKGWAVALLAEGVDRNLRNQTADFFLTVALLAEGVDRNTVRNVEGVDLGASPSSRRAWIEML